MPRRTRPPTGPTLASTLLATVLGPPPFPSALVPALAASLAGALMAPARVAAQRGELRVDVGSATSLPAAGVEGDAAFYGVAGLGMEWDSGRFGVSAGLHGGLAVDDTRGGDFGTAVLRAEGWTGPGTAVGLAGEAYGFRVRAPWTYRTEALTGGPAVRWKGERLELRVRGDVGAGRSVVELRRTPDGPVRRLEVDLWSRGVVAGASVQAAGFLASLEGGGWETAGGPFRKAGLSAAIGGAALAARGEVAVWDTPLGTEWVGGVAVLIPIGDRVTATASGGRGPPDPLALVEAGGQGGLIVGVRLVELGSDGSTELYTLALDGPVARVRFQVEGRGASCVEILGDFTRWEPRAMDEGEDGRWTLELAVPPGTYHFGFRVDGEWYVPPGRPGNTPDEWGRVNATLVVPGPVEERGR